MKGRIALLLVGLCLLGVVTDARATVFYTDLIGAGAGEVDFLNMQEATNTTGDPEPLFGQPSRLDNTLSFPQVSFSAASSDGVADQTSATFQVVIQADVGQYLDGITIIDTGHYSKAGPFTAATDVSVSGAAFVVDLTHGGSPIPGVPSETWGPPVIVNDTETGSFQAMWKIDLFGMGIEQVQLTFNNNLSATSETGTNSQIVKDSVQIIVPEPFSAGLFLVGAVALLRRRR